MAEPDAAAAAAAVGASGTEEAGPGFERLNIPFVLDRINVTDPELIKKITVHSDIDRVHGVPTEDKPWWIKAYFPTTRFLDRDDEMFVPLTSTRDPRYMKRRTYVTDRVEDGVDAEDVRKIAYLMHSGAPQDELERAVVNGVNRRFYGKDVPEDVVESAGKTADKLADAVTSLYFPAVHHQGKVMDFIESNNELHGGCPVADFSHHIGAAVQLLTPSCQFLHKEKDRTRPILDIFTQNDMPMTVQTPRIALRDTTLDGLLDEPAKANWTVFILQIREAAAATKDSLFTFGAGVDERQCAFKFAFQKLMADLQAELARLEATDKAAKEEPAAAKAPATG
ncbi:unnamed protein product [Pylaiella littoralis]